MYRNIQNDCRLTFFLGAINSNCRYRAVLPDDLMSLKEAYLWECWQRISHHRYRFSLKLKVISITDTDVRLERDYFCNNLVATAWCCACFRKNCLEWL